MAGNLPLETESSPPKSASIIALAGGVIILLGGLIFIGASIYVIPHLNFSNMTVPQGFNRANLPGLVSGVVGVMGAIGIVCGSVVLMSAAMLLARVGQRRTWGVLILIFSVLSFIGLGGFIVGAILGITGGILVLRWKPPSRS
jgi:hypothetical protein